MVVDKSEDGRVKKYLTHKFRLAWRFYSEKRRACLKEKACVACKKRNVLLIADHVEPVVDTKKGFEGWDNYYRRMFYGELQPLCKPCHKLKTQKENKERRKRAK